MLGQNVCVVHILVCTTKFLSKITYSFTFLLMIYECPLSDAFAQIYQQLLKIHLPKILLLIYFHRNISFGLLPERPCPKIIAFSSIPFKSNVINSFLSSISFALRTHEIEVGTRN